MRSTRIAVFSSLGILLLALGACVGIFGCQTGDQANDGNATDPAARAPVDAEMGEVSGFDAAGGLGRGDREGRMTDVRPGTSTHSESGGAGRSDPGSSRVDQIIDSMTVDELIGQRFIVYLPGKRVNSKVERIIRNGHPAGFILYPWNYEDPADVKRLTGRLQSVARASHDGVGLILCADQEGGRVAAFRFDDIVRLPSAHDMASYQDPAFVRSAGYITGVQLRELGLNMNLAPVLDVYGVADDSVIGDRSFAGNPLTVSTLGTAFIEGLHAAGIMAVGKHFPGHGVSTVDSHMRLPVSQASLADLRHRHLPPFEAAIAKGVDGIMTAHILFPEIDDTYPVTLSPTFLQELLRERLGFDGVVLSDGVEMRALSGGFTRREVLRHALSNGIDLLLLYTHFELLNMTRIVHDMLEKGEVTVAELRAGARRVLELKARYGLL